MKHTFFVILFTFATATTFAQGAGTKQQAAQTVSAKTLEEKANAITASMVKNLRLTPEQASKLKVINLNSMQAAEEAQVKYKSEPRKIVQQIDIISQTRLSQIKDILTPYQFTQYQQRREEKMGVPKEAQSNPASRQQSAAYQEQY